MMLGVDATSSTLQYGFVSELNNQVFQHKNQANVERLPYYLSELLNNNDIKLSGLLTVLGPGSYTGIRLSLSAMKMLYMVHQVPLIGKSLFDFYMDVNHHYLNQLTVLSSNSRKGYFNVQMFQCDTTVYQNISSILQLSHDQFKVFIEKFEKSIVWHHIGDDFSGLNVDNLNLNHVVFKHTKLDLLHVIKENQSVILNQKTQSDLVPIYSV